jgi:hypothetical protein
VDPRFKVLRKAIAEKGVLHSVDFVGAGKNIQSIPTSHSEHFIEEQKH